ncbi:RNA polymerase Rpc34 [Globomyces pollinis-pini]|nr:RNA polymerase Rpc34 [Globomyces pollinis-pini]
MNDHERMIYDYLKTTGNKGSWSKTIKDRLGMHVKLVNDAIKSLEKKKFIKLIKSVKNPTKKVYMLFEYQPNEELTGGSWYDSATGFDSDYIENLCAQIYKYILSKSFPKNSLYPSSYKEYPTTKNIHSWVQGTGMSSQPLSLTDIQNLIDRLIFDGLVIKHLHTSAGDEDDMEYYDDDMNVPEGTLTDIWMYQAMRKRQFENPWTDSPCGKCPVFEFCKVGGPINPANCEYLTQWMKF